MEPINAEHQDTIYTVKQDHLMLLVRYKYLLLHVHWENGSKIYMSYTAVILIKSAHEMLATWYIVHVFGLFP